MKIIIWVALLILIVVCWYFRLDIISWVQYKRLQSLKCSDQNASCISKLWVHRVNSTKRYELLKGRFEGFESDIMFEPDINTFMVYHPPSDEGKFYWGELIRKVIQNKKKIWFDTRGVNSSSMLSAFRSIDSLDAEFYIKGSAIFEIYDPDAATILANKGYTVSLNIPVDKIRDTTWCKNINQHLSPAVKYVSQESNYVKELEDKFPGKDVITWSLAFKNFWNLKRLENLLNDKKIKVILINVKSRYYY